MRIGTKSVLYGAHCFFLHPWFVAWAWWRLYGFPWDPRLWVAFFVHDLGYVGKPNMDGPEGERHPDFGADLMGVVFGEAWGELCLLHSRNYSKKLGLPFSRLCVADKLAIALTPAWLYLPTVHWTGEIHEYLKMAQHADDGSRFAAADYTGGDVRAWHAELCRYMREWVAAHQDGGEDTWTSADRHAKTASGVWR